MHLSLFVAAVALLFSIPLHAATIDLGNVSGNNGDPFRSYTQDGFLVSSDGSYVIGKVPYFGIDDLEAGNFSGTVASLTVSRLDGGAFTFTSVGLINFQDAMNYNFAGSFGRAAVFSQSGNLGFTFPFYPEIGSSRQSLPLTSLTITESGEGFGIRYITGEPSSATVPLTSTPEPSSFAFLVTGLLGLTGVVKRRFA